MLELHGLRRLTSTLLIAMLAALTLARASAQDSSPEAGGAGNATGNESETPRTVDEEVIVRGQRLSEIEFDLHLYIKNFINEVAAPARSRGYARWQRKVCIGVYNLQRTISQYIVDRISSLALNLGLEPGEPGCEAQVQIVFTSDGKQTASLMVENEPRTFRPIGGNAGMDLGLDALYGFNQERAASLQRNSIVNDIAQRELGENDEKGPASE